MESQNIQADELRSVHENTMAILAGFTRRQRRIVLSFVKAMAREERRSGEEAAGDE